MIGCEFADFAGVAIGKSRNGNGNGKENGRKTTPRTRNPNGKRIRNSFSQFYRGTSFEGTKFR